MNASIALEKMTRKELLAKAYFYKGACHAALNEHVEAIKFYHYALSIKPEEPYILLAKAVSTIENNDIQQALQIADSLIQQLNTLDIRKEDQSEIKANEEDDDADIFFR